MNSVNRRNFFQICSSLVASLAALGPSVSIATAPTQFYHRVQFMRHSKPMRATDFEEGQVYIFHYPYQTTPCMIFNLGESTVKEERLLTESSSPYLWNGGVGPVNSIVAYSAICSHRMTYPAKTASFLNYRHSNVVFFDVDHTRQKKSKIIYCCSERSVYDAKLGAKVLGGPAKQPLTSIELDYSAANDTLFAVGTRGGEMYNEFLTKFEYRLKLDFGIDAVDELTTKNVELKTIEEYSAVIVEC